MSAHAQNSVVHPHLETLEDRVVPALVGDLVFFGDSLSDVGNVDSIPNLDVPPEAFYFQGRFSGGPIWADTLAEYLGEGGTTPALLGGLNYAFGGAGVLTNSNPQVPTVVQQVGLYLSGHVPEADDVFAIWAGANDFFSTSGAANVATVASTLGDAMEGLVALGARQFVVANLPPLGQTPYFQDLLALGAIPPSAVTGADDWSVGFNYFLSLELAAIDAMPGVSVVAVDIPGILATLAGPSNPLGLTNTTDAVGPYDFGSGFLTGITGDPDDYLYFDSIHPGSGAQQYIGLQAAADVLESLGHNTLTVKTTADAVNPLDGKLSLREAVNLANTMGGTQTIQFALGSGSRVISLNSELSITDDTTIRGSGAARLALNGQHQTRIFNIAAGAEVSLRDMTLQNGRAEQGGAIHNAGDLSIDGVIFLNNSARGANARGGAIYNTGELEVLRSVFIGNSAIGTSTAYGGAIASVGSGHVEVRDSVLTANVARAPQAWGGAIYVGSGGSLRLVRTIVAANAAVGSGSGQGGGVYLANNVLFSQLGAILLGNFATTGGKNLFVA